MWKQDYIRLIITNYSQIYPLRCFSVESSIIPADHANSRRCCVSFVWGGNSVIQVAILFIITAQHRDSSCREVIYLCPAHKRSRIRNKQASKWHSVAEDRNGTTLYCTRSSQGKTELYDSTVNSQHRAQQNEEKKTKTKNDAVVWTLWKSSTSLIFITYCICIHTEKTKNIGDSFPMSHL